MIIMKVQFNPKRSAVVVAASFCLAFLMIYKLILSTGLVPNADPSVDIVTATIMDSEARRITVEGQFLDRNGDAITEPGERGKAAKLLQPKAYSFLIGYNSPIYDTSGLRDRLYGDLFYGGEDGIGATVTLTTDNALQQFCYDHIGSHEGSVIVMNAHTGEVLACASRSSGEIEYDVNIIDQRYDANGDGVVNSDDPRMYSLYASYPSFFLNRATTSEDPPGSTFKMATGAAMIENGLGDYTFDDLDGTYEVAGTVVRNVMLNKDTRLTLGAGADMALAMRKSANVYFASGAVEMGARAFQETAERFLLCQPVYLDFATLKPNFDLGNMNDKALLAHTGYGQGNLKVSPLQVGMIMGAVMNEGRMMMPYLIQTITDDGEVERQTEPAAAVQTAVVEGVEQVIDETPPMQPETAETLKKYLHETALGYGLDEESYGMVYAKTGTAESTSENHIYMVAAVEDTSWGDLVVVVDRAHVSGSSSDLKGTMKDILGYLVTA